MLNVKFHREFVFSCRRCGELLTRDFLKTFRAVLTRLLLKQLFSTENRYRETFFSFLQNSSYLGAIEAETDVFATRFAHSSAIHKCGTAVLHQPVIFHCNVELIGSVEFSTECNFVSVV